MTELISLQKIARDGAEGEEANGVSGIVKRQEVEGD
jgi:hypothetical protein